MRRDSKQSTKVQDKPGRHSQAKQHLAIRGHTQQEPTSISSLRTVQRRRTSTTDLQTSHHGATTHTESNQHTQQAYSQAKHTHRSRHLRSKQRTIILRNHTISTTPAPGRTTHFHLTTWEVEKGTTVFTNPRIPQARR